MSEYAVLPVLLLLALHHTTASRAVANRETMSASEPEGQALCAQ